MIVATPGRLEDMLKRQQDDLNLAAGVKALVGGSLNGGGGGGSSVALP